jgi:anhydro-N-acetylmuramic acid kinase
VPEILEDLLRHPFILRAPPKSTGRETFNPAFVAAFRDRLARSGTSAVDGLATLAAFTVQAVSRNLRAFVFPFAAVREVVVMGGGAENATLMRGLADALPEYEVLPAEALGVPGRAVEALAFAALAYLTARGRPGNLPRVTGARGLRVLGCIVPGANYRGLIHG